MMVAWRGMVDGGIYFSSSSNEASVMRLSSSLVNRQSSVPRLAEAVVKLSNGATVSGMRP